MFFGFIFILIGLGIKLMVEKLIKKEQDYEGENNNGWGTRMETYPTTSRNQFMSRKCRDQYPGWTCMKPWLGIGWNRLGRR